MTFFKFEQPREAKTVYDEKGRTYAWYGEHIESGYVVQPIYEVTSTYWCDGHEVPDYNISYGDFTVLTEMYEEPPKQKYATETLELQEKIETLKTELKSLKDEHIKLIHAQSLSVEGVLREKLNSSELNTEEVNTLISALTNQMELYSVTSTGKIISKASDYVAVHLRDKSHPIHFFRKTNEGWEKYNCNNIKADLGHVSFTSLELAEEYLLNKIMNGENYGESLIDCLIINDVFKKHNINPPEHWINYIKQNVDKEIEKVWEKILDLYECIRQRKEQIKHFEKSIKKLNKIMDGSIPSEKEYREMTGATETQDYLY